MKIIIVTTMLTMASFLEANNTAYYKVFKYSPKIVVFDVDRVLWPSWVDFPVYPPFIKTRNGNVVDRRGRVLKHNSGTLQVFKYLLKNRIPIGVASRTRQIKAVMSLITLFDWDQFISNKQIYPGKKTTHLFRISRACRLPYHDILFFNDAPVNAVGLNRMGIITILINEGITMPILMKGLEKFESTRMVASTKEYKNITV